MSPPASRSVLLFTALAAMLAAACARGSSATRRYDSSIHVESDPGVPLPNAVLRVDNRVIGRSNARGQVKLGAYGSEGEQVRVFVDCPEGYQSPDRPLTVQLRQSSDPARLPEYSVRCHPSFRTLVVAVRAQNGPRLPILYLGREIARTDEQGVAHVLLKAAPNEDVQLALDTSENPRLRPRSPSVSFQVHDADDILLFEQTFQVTEPPARHSAHPQSGPIHIR